MGNRQAVNQSPKQPIVSAPEMILKKCNICTKDCPDETITQYKLYVYHRGVCEACCVIHNVVTYDYLRDKNRFHMAECGYCVKIKKCLKQVMYRNVNVCSDCYSYYKSDNEKTLCFQDFHDYCQTTKCKYTAKHAEKSKVHYIDLTDQYVCLNCLIIHGATNKQINKAIDETYDKKDSTYDVLQFPLDYDKSALLAIPDHWTCTDKQCTHAKCGLL